MRTHATIIAMVIGLFIAGCGGSKTTIKEDTQTVSVTIPARTDTSRLVVSPFVIPMGLRPDLHPVGDRPTEVFTTAPDDSRTDPTVSLLVPAEAAGPLRPTIDRVRDDLRRLDSAGARIVTEIPASTVDTTVPLNKVTVTEEEPVLEKYLGYLAIAAILLAIIALIIRYLKR